MKKKALKRIQYANLPGTILGIVVSTCLLGLILFEIVTGDKNMSDSILIVGLVFFAACLLFYLWRLFAKKPLVQYINMNGWEYRLFQKTSKWKFICVSGFVNAAKNNSIIVVLFLFNLIENDASYLELLLFILGINVISAIPWGYMTYKKYNSIH
ncbi:hypothetical protein [Bacteroides graminisolvens]|uniref:hypothetical protein n=1 Tax=Bacteroides graminisolvens TaxID=477666 RepID=UPI00240A19DA|nr:hypothetical protein [Bacteroides graminisolvens]